MGPNAIPWYKSQILHSLIVVAVTHALTHYKLISQFTPEDIGQAVDGILSFIGFAATAYAGWSRITQKAAPTITTTQTKADVKNVQPQENPCPPQTPLSPQPPPP